MSLSFEEESPACGSRLWKESFRYTVFTFFWFVAGSTCTSCASSGLEGMVFIQFLGGLRIPYRFRCYGAPCFTAVEDFLSDLTDATIDWRDFLRDAFSSSISLNLAESMSDSDGISSLV